MQKIAGMDAQDAGMPFI